MAVTDGRNSDSLMSVVFLADFFSHQINGGGENNDAVLIEYLRSRGLTVDLVHTQKITKEILDSADKVIVSNFVLLSPEIKDYIRENCDYIIYEHDHKYVKTRDPSRFVGFSIPPSQLVNTEFYKGATAVIVLSKICKQVMEDNVGNPNVHSIGTSLWSQEKIAFLRECDKKKTKEFAIVNSSNPTKGRDAAVAFCKNRGIEFDLISSSDQYEFLKTLSQYDSLVFIPQVLETFCRLIAEAKMLNCKVYTNPTLIGLMSEPYGNLSGGELIDVLEKKVAEALEYFYGIVTT